jgi:hypothetical protein
MRYIIASVFPAIVVNKRKKYCGNNEKKYSSSTKKAGNQALIKLFSGKPNLLYTLFT